MLALVLSEAHLWLALPDGLDLLVQSCSRLSCRLLYQQLLASLESPPVPLGDLQLACLAKLMSAELRQLAYTDADGVPR